MIIKKKIILFLFFFIASCSNVEYVYNDTSSTTIPIYEKTRIEVSGVNSPSVYRHSLNHFGQNKDPKYILYIYLEENKTKRSVKSNQSIIKEDYELKFTFDVYNIESTCFVYKKKIVSKFSYTPKSSGYNFGSDQSLEKNYDLAIKKSLVRFTDFLVSTNKLTCLNEN